MLPELGVPVRVVAGLEDDIMIACHPPGGRMSVCVYPFSWSSYSLAAKEFEVLIMRGVPIMMCTRRRH